MSLAAKSPLSFPTDAHLENLPDAFQSLDAEWRYTYLNRRAEQILGRSRENLLGRICWEEYPQSVGTSFYQKCLEASSTRRTIVFEDFSSRDGAWAEHTLHPYSEGLGVFTRNITNRKRTEEAVRRNEQQFHALFDQIQNAVLLADDSGRYTDANAAACQLFGMPCEELLGKSLLDFSPPALRAQAQQAWERFLQTGEQTGEFILYRPDGTFRTLDFRAKANVRPGIHLSILRDITERIAAEERTERLLTELAAERDTLDTVNRVGRLLSAELDQQKLVQAATDAATELTGAQFGAFFYNTLNEQNESLLLYTISGAPMEAFSRFPHPRATPLFGPTFRGEGIIRIGDVTKDSRFGHMSPYHGMPPEHLPVRSYLAVPVMSRSGEVLGGLFFGHAEPDVFTPQAERNLEALVAQIAIAVDNARLFSQAQREAENQTRQARYAALRADVSAALAEGGDLPEILQRCAEPIVKHLDAAFARIWTLDAPENVLILRASAGMYTHLDGPHARVPVGEKKIGLIAQEKKAYLSNDVLADERISEKEWARREGMAAFAGYPLLLEDRVVGVVALFARHTLASDTLDTLASVAGALAQGVERKQIEQRLTESRTQQRIFLRDVLASVTGGRLRLCTTPDELPAPLPTCGDTVFLDSRSLRAARQSTVQATKTVGLNVDRGHDLLTAVGEATMNAVRHGGGGQARACTDVTAGIVQVWVEDRGSGIAVDQLPQATLERGYSGSDGFGHGFWLMLQTVDKVWLLTNPSGTTIVIEQGRAATKPGWLKDK